MTNLQSQDFFDTIAGHVISGGDVTEDGMHLFLDDGRIIVLAGTFVAGVVVISKETLQ